MRAEELAPDFRVLSEDGHILGLGGWAAIFGSLMGGIADLLHSYLLLDDAVGIATAISESEAWVPIHLVIVIGIILILGGLVGLQRSLRGGLGVAPARFGLAAAVAGVAVASRTMTIIGPSVITAWLLVIGFLQLRRSRHQLYGLT